MIIFIKKAIGSGLFSGFFPFAPGTIGSVFAVVIFLIPGFENYYIIVPSIIISFIIGIPLGNYFEEIYSKDPQQFTLDEFTGMWIALLATPKSIELILLTFVVWRILDIYKPFPANKAEKLNGGWGIMLDDVVSGMYSLIFIIIFKILFN